MANPVLGVAVVLFGVLFLVYTAFQIKRRKLLLRYTLSWIFLAILILLFSVFPYPIFAMADLLGFDTPSNFVFLLAIFFLLFICLDLTKVTSKVILREKTLTQRIAIIEKQLSDDAGEKD